MGRLLELAALVPAATAPGGGDEPEAGAFLDCAEAVVPVVEALGVTLTPVQIDMKSNTKRLRKRLAEAGPEQVRSVFDFVREEKVRGQHTSNSGCTKGLLWLLRAMRFVERLIRSLSSSKEVTVSEAATDAYNAVLKPYHGWVTYGVFQAAMSALPLSVNRESLVATLGGGEETLAEEGTALVEALGPLLGQVLAFLEAEGCNFPDKV